MTIGTVLTGWYDNLTGQPGILNPAPDWKIAAIQSLRNSSYTQVKPYSVGGGEELEVDVQHPLFSFLPFNEKMAIYKQYLIDAGIFEQAGMNPLTSALDDILAQFKTVTQNTSPPVMGKFIIALGIVGGIWYFYRKKK